jgi:hypothetical protein
VTRPTNESNLLRPGARDTLLFCTRHVELHKASKYAKIAQTNGYTMIPFVVETYGGCGKQASALLQRLSRSSEEYSSREFLLHARRKLSAVLQTANANSMLLAQQQYLLEQHARDPHLHAEWQLRRQLNLGASRPVSSNKLARRLEDQFSSEGPASSDSFHPFHSSTAEFVFEHASRLGSFGCMWGGEAARLEAAQEDVDDCESEVPIAPPSPASAVAA